MQHAVPFACERQIACRAKREELTLTGSAGGSATNSGIDFQQRIAALVMAHMLCKEVDIPALHLEGIKIRSIACETGDSIDDLTIRGDEQEIFIQAKTTITMSDLETSEYSSVIRQFVKQHLRDPKAGNRYILATSPAASSRVTKDLRKITTSVRLNEDWSSNPLTKSEKEVLSKTRNLVNLHYRTIATKEPSDQETSALLRKMFVAVLDIEEGGSLEQAVRFLLASKSQIPPQLLWSGLISLGLTLARSRLSIDQTGLSERMGRYFTSKGTQQEVDHRESFFALTELGRRISSGREVLLVESPYEKADLLLVELMRFAEDGQLRTRFVDGQAILANDLRWKVVRRFSTYAGFQRYAEGRPAELEGKKLVWIPINSEEEFDASPYALAHSELCDQLFKENPNPFCCLHCGEFISEDMAPLVEVDEEGVPHSVGLVHQVCVTAIDRSIGGISSELFQEHKLLKNFDYHTWYERIQKGQAVFRGSRPSSVAVVGWQPYHNDFSSGRWCVRVDLEDGSSRYITERAKVARRSERAAIEDAAELNAAIKQSRQKGDPFCYSQEDGTSTGESFGTYSRLITLGRTPVVCEKAAAAPYSRSIAESYNDVENFYAPLAFLVDTESGDPIVIADVITLITNPLELHKFLQNWQRAGVELEDFTVSVISTDERFDRFIHLAQAQHLKVIVDPLLTPSGDLVRGYPIENFNRLMEAGGDQ